MHGRTGVAYGVGGAQELQVARRVSQYEHAKSIIKRMRLGREQARGVATKAFEADLEAGRPDLALKCAKEFKLEDALITRAATALFAAFLQRRAYAKAFEVARSYNLAHAPEARPALEAAARLEDSSVELEQIRALARAAAGARREVSEADRAIELIRTAKEVRDRDPRVQGRAVVLEGDHEVWLAGDLHGSAVNLKRLAQAADLASHPERILVLQEIVHSRLITADNRDLSFVAIMDAIQLVAQHPGQVYYLLGNHDLAVAQNRELVKGGKYLNRYLFRGMAFMYRERYEQVLEEYRAFIGGMPAAVLAANGVFMAHSTPKRPFIPSISREFLTGAAAERPLTQQKALAALVNGRDFAPESAEEFAQRLECDVMLCGHTPTPRGFALKSKRHLIVDSQHEKAYFVRFRLDQRFSGAEELAGHLEPLWPDSEEAEIVGELM